MSWRPPCQAMVQGVCRLDHYNIMHREVSKSLSHMTADTPALARPRRGTSGGHLTHIGNLKEAAVIYPEAELTRESALSG